jgi:DNA-binding MarR family transcriptional regulator
MSETPAAGADGLVRQFARGESTGFLVYQLNLLWQRQLAQALSPVGITHVQFAVLAATWHLAEGGQLPRQGEVSDYARVSAAMTSTVMTTLLGRGWVVRAADQRDGRASRLAVTDAGYAMLEQAVVVMRQAENDFFGDDQTALRRALTEVMPSV